MSHNEVLPTLITQSKAFIHDISSPLLIAHTYVTETSDQVKSLLSNANNRATSVTSNEELQLKLKKLDHLLEQGLIALSRLEKLSEDFKAAVLSASSQNT